MLTHWFATYSNLISFLEMKTKGKIEEGTPLPQEEQTQFINTIHEIRFRVEVTNVQFHALKEHLKGKIKLCESDEKEVAEVVARMKSKFIVALPDLETYVKALHKFLLQDIVSDLMKTSKEIVNEVFSKE